MTVTIREVARAAGVSQATAARVLGGYGYARPGARERVRARGGRLGYTPNAVARALVARATDGGRPGRRRHREPVLRRRARGLADVLEPAGYTVLLANADEDAGRERSALDALRARRVDGLVVVPAPGGAPGGDPCAAGVPLVQLDRAVRGVRADAVMVDNGAASARAVDHLLELGHRRIGLVSDSPRSSSTPSGSPATGGRFAGLVLRVDAALESIGGSTQADGRRSAHALLSRPDRPTAIFTANNFMTVGALLAMRDLGLRAPEDVALVGFDDLDWTTLVEPAVTVVAQPVADLGRAAGERLLARMGGDDGPPRRIRLRTTLVVRASCGARA